jgi:hypothetical protein
MIISRCPKTIIEQAARETGIRISDIEALSSTGLRHRVKLGPSAHKTLRVEAGERIFHKHSAALRERFSVAYDELNMPYEPQELLRRLVVDPTQFLFPEPIVQQAEKLAHAIVGESRPVYKRIAPYQRRSLGNHDRACGALCWHGFRDFFIRLFALHPTARCFTAYSIYDGSEGFYKNYPETGSRNIGSTFNPLSADEACWCEG